MVGQDQTVCYNRCVMGCCVSVGVRGTEVEVLGKDGRRKKRGEEGGRERPQRVWNEAIE